MKILIVEDEKKTGEYLTKGLTEAGFVVDLTDNGLNGYHLAMTSDYDLLILDIMLPDVNGWDIVRMLRAAGKGMPILLLTALGTIEHRVKGLELGADDYLAKPFSMLELVARVKALFRRQEAMSRNLRLDAGALSFNDLTIDPIAREVRLHQQPIELTPREFDLLYFFARHPGQVFSRLSLLNQVWGYQHEGYEHTVNTHINRLRIKIERNPAEPERILTVWGMGYKFAAAPQE